LGGTVVDVMVRHKVYGQISAPLNIYSAAGIQQFIKGIESGKSSELMHVTSGYHYHTIRAESYKHLDRIEAALKARGYLIEEQ
jgi:transcriptional regulator of NAD metabolism